METTSKRPEVLRRLIRAGVRPDFAERAVKEKKITHEDIDWNERLGRPANFKETQEPEAEVERRKAWTLVHGS